MGKKILILFAVITVAVLLALGFAVRKLPDWVVQGLRQTLGREVSVESIRLKLPLQVEMSRLLISENEPFKGEPALSVERAVAAIDLIPLLRSKKLVFTDLELLRPKIIFRKLSGKVYSAFRLRAAGTGEAPGAGADEASGPLKVPSIEFGHITIRDGQIDFLDYDADRKGFVISLLRLTADIRDLALPANERRLRFTAETYLDQGRVTNPAHLTLSGEWSNPKMDGDLSMDLSGVWIPYFKPYYEYVTPSRIEDAELDIVASAQSRNGDLTANSKWSVRRLAFAQTESGNELFGFDANLIKNILTNGSGNISLDLVFQMNLRDRTTPFSSVLRKSLIQSIKANFFTNFNTALQNTVSQLTDENSELLKSQNWKDLIKKNKINDVIDKVMGSQ